MEPERGESGEETRWRESLCRSWLSCAIGSGCGWGKGGWRWRVLVAANVGAMGAMDPRD